MTNGLQWATFGVAAYAAIGTTVAGTITSVQSRIGARDAWRREMLGERYIALQEALAAWVDIVDMGLSDTFDLHPMPSLDADWRSANQAYARVTDEINRVVIVGESHTRDAVNSFSSIVDMPALFPVAWEGGGIASWQSDQRRDALDLLADAYAYVMASMRVDLNLMPTRWHPRQRRAITLKLKERQQELTAARRNSREVKFAEMNDLELRAELARVDMYRIANRGHVGDTEDYVVPDDLFDQIADPLQLSIPLVAVVLRPPAAPPLLALRETATPDQRTRAYRLAIRLLRANFWTAPMRWKMGDQQTRIYLMGHAILSTDTPNET